MRSQDIGHAQSGYTHGESRARSHSLASCPACPGPVPGQSGPSLPTGLAPRRSPRHRQQCVPQCLQLVPGLTSRVSPVPVCVSAPQTHTVSACLSACFSVPAVCVSVSQCLQLVPVCLSASDTHGLSVPQCLRHTRSQCVSVPASQCPQCVSQCLSACSWSPVSRLAAHRATAPPPNGASPPPLPSCSPAPSASAPSPPSSPSSPSCALARYSVCVCVCVRACACVYERACVCERVSVRVAPSASVSPSSPSCARHTSSRAPPESRVAMTQLRA
jgi:hypothetical protein